MRLRVLPQYLLAISLLVAQAAAAADKPRFLPPLTPKLDSPASPGSSVKSPSSQQSSGSSAGSESGSSPPPSEEPKKSLLKEALEKHNKGDLLGAERLLRQVLSIDPHNVDANFNLGALAEERSDLPGALNFYYAASRVSPADRSIRDAITSVKEKLQKQQGVALSAQQMERKAQLREIAADASAAFKACNFDRAILDLQILEKEAPNDPNVQFGLGQAYRAKGDQVRAREYLNRAIMLDPSNPLYISALNHLDQGVQPPAFQAPNMVNDYQNQRNYSVGAQGWAGANNNTPGNDSEPSGQLQPFTDQGATQLYGRAAASPGGDWRSSVGLGQALGLGSLFGLGAMTGGVGSLFGSTPVASPPPLRYSPGYGYYRTGGRHGWH